ncbi:collagen-binding domain-containing protein [Aquimarina sp. RZ0]|uniref:collagen-binding domain-containing protein n=1 Tax=Aquimarina sp. RZ0 TaxID=2607730 RepID=UPI0011F3DA09|nr:collagen-binding domain-containing protein [Aquimarina sp. RZ0]KAA1245402.1 choice-of-anchor A family protein [Aquimarina sp. RZ0]
MSKLTSRLNILSQQIANPKVVSFLFSFSMLVIFMMTTGFGSIDDDKTEAATTSTVCKNPLAAALGYNAFVRYETQLKGGDTEGPIALGGDLTMSGIITVAAQTAGTNFFNGDDQPSSLVVNGKVLYESGEGIYLNQGYVKVGDPNGSFVHDLDTNNATTNTRVTSGDYNAIPRVQVQRKQSANSVKNGGLIDFEAAFTLFEAKSIEYSTLIANVSISNDNKIYLTEDTVNVINLSGAELQNLSFLTFETTPNQNTPLIINVDASTDFEWDVLNLTGIGDPQGAYILWNFYNTSNITLVGGGTIIGSLFAPTSNVVKDSSGNINGQVIAANYYHKQGELHQHVFDSCTEEEVCEVLVDAGDDQEICLGDEVILTATVDGNTSCENCIEYGIQNTNSCRRDENYVFWLTDGDNSRWFSNVDLEWNELADGTATLTGTIFDYTLTQTTYEVDATFTGKTSDAPQGSPKEHFCNNEDSTGWIYYTGLTGRVTSTDGSWSIDISRRGPAFQLGNGANQAETAQGKFAASGWFNTTDSQYDRGDFNIVFGDCVSTGTNNTSFLWSTGETTESITVSPEQDTTYTVTVTNCNDCSATDEVLVTVKSAVVDAGDDQTVCLGDTVTLTATGEGTLEWSTGETTESIIVSPTETTTYTVTVTNGSCEATDSVTVIVNDPIVVDAGEDQEICLGDEVTLTAQVSGVEDCIDCKEYLVEGTDYCAGDHNFVIWLTNQDRSDRRWYSNVDLVWEELENGTATLKGTVLDYTVTQETYEVDVLYSGKTTTAPVDSPKAHECNDEDAVGWAYYPEMSGTITKTDGSEVINITRRGESFQVGNGANVFETEVGKNGASGWLNVTDGYFAYGDININFGDCINPGTGEVQYLWSTGETTESITVSPEEDTTYTVTVTGCTTCEDTDEVVVTVNSATAYAGADQDICLGDTATLTVSGSGDILWSTGETTASIEVSPDTTTTYSVIVTNGNCAASDDLVVTVNSVAVDAGEDQTIASGESATLTVTGGDTYLWSTGETTETIVVSPEEDTTYTVTAYSNGCEATDNVTVYIEGCSVVADAGEDQTICLISNSGPSVVNKTTIQKASTMAEVFLTASGGDTYLWSTGETTQSISVNPTQDTTYTVTVTSGSCSDTDEVTVFVTELGADAGLDVEIVEGENITLTASGGDSYLWSTGETTQSIIVSPTRTTNYGVTVFKGSCSAYDEVIVNVGCKGTANAGEDQTICAGEVAVLTSSSGDLIRWSTGEFGETITVSPTETTTYSVTIIKNGCLDIDEVTIVVESCGGGLGGGPTIVNNIYPTVLKSSDNVSLEISTTEKNDTVRVSLYSLSGIIMGPTMNMKVAQGDNVMNIDLSKINVLPSGIYVVKVSNKEGDKLMKIVVN